MSRPIIAITMGDPTGIGPEIVMRCLAHAEIHAACHPLVIGDVGRLRQAGEIVGSALGLHAVSADSPARFAPGMADVVDVGLVPPELPFGIISAVAGEAAYRAAKRTRNA